MFEQKLRDPRVVLSVANDHRVVLSVADLLTQGMTQKSSARAAKQTMENNETAEMRWGLLGKDVRR